MEWTREQIGELSRLWADGLATAEIGRRLGITKNAVVGKVHRLGLPPRQSPIKERPKQPAAVMAPPKPKVMEFKGPACCWPIGHPREPGFHFCGAAAAQGKPYCAEHAAKAYVPNRPGRSERAA